MVNSHANLLQLFPVHHSAYRQSRSTKTEVITVHNNIAQAINSGQVSALMLHDLSTAFDTVDHCILMGMILFRFGVFDRVH